MSLRGYLDKINSVLATVNYTLPVQLLLIQLRKYKSLLFFWVVVIGVVSGAIGKSMGITYLFLEPEYLGTVSFWSLFIVGSALGAFIFAYMITLYINESYRFQFIALERSPFFTFSVNNGLLPSVFLCAYFYRYVEFQMLTYGELSFDVYVKMMGLAGGIIAVFLLFSSYFFATNSNIFKSLGESVQRELAKAQKGKVSKVIVEKAKVEMKKRYRVDSYFNFPFTYVRTDNLAPVDFRKIIGVLNQHHGNLLFLQLCVVAVVVLLGLLDSDPRFQIPAAASVLLTFSLIIMIAGAITFWFRKIGGFVFVLLIAFLWTYPHMSFLHEKNHAYGLDYETEAAPYNQEVLQTFVSDAEYKADREATLRMLNRWKLNYQNKYGPYQKPKAVLVSTSGGGLRATFWTFQVMQDLDSLTQGELSDNIRLMTGASGGMFGLAYFRELYLQQLDDELTDLNDPQYLDAVSKDLLNRVIYRSFTDIFLPNRKVTVGGKKYDKERGFSFDNQLAMNMPQLEGKRLSDYAQAEAEGKIPVMVLSPSILNQARKLYISANGVSFLARPSTITAKFTARPTGIEFRRMFAAQDADSLFMTTALRMNATFPFVLPIVTLPSDPPMDVMDAGAIDNYGTGTSVRYLYEFREWFAKNTESVLIVQIRDNQREDPIDDTSKRTAFDKMMRPVGAGYISQTEAKDMAIDEMLAMATEWYKGNIEVVSFEYPQETSNFPASLSLHLTEFEKQNIRASVSTDHNRQSFETVRSLYKSELLAKERKRLLSQTK